MAALTKAADRPIRDGDVVVLPVAASTKIHQGGLVQVSGGNAKPATKASSLVFMGVATHSVDNSSGSAGDAKVEVRRNVAAHFKVSGGAVKAGETAYALDDQTITKTSTSASKVGLIIEVDGDGAWVDLGSN